MWLARKGSKFNLLSICSADTVARDSGEAERNKRRFRPHSPTEEGQLGASTVPGVRSLELSFAQASQFHMLMGCMECCLLNASSY